MTIIVKHTFPEISELMQEGDILALQPPGKTADFTLFARNGKQYPWRVVKACLRGKNVEWGMVDFFTPAALFRIQIQYGSRNIPCGLYVCEGHQYNRESLRKAVHRWYVYHSGALGGDSIADIADITRIFNIPAGASVETICFEFDGINMK